MNVDLPPLLHLIQVPCLHCCALAGQLCSAPVRTKSGVHYRRERAALRMRERAQR